MLRCNKILNGAAIQHLMLSIGDGNSVFAQLERQIMQSNQKTALTAVRPAEGQVFARTHAALANSARSFQTRQQVSRELALLSDRALADLGLYRSDIAGFARDASRIEGAEGVFSALTADLKALLGFHGATGTAGRKMTW
jgi:uncharacterized protein YjiS (DUF1127 family)